MTDREAVRAAIVKALTGGDDDSPLLDRLTIVFVTLSEDAECQIDKLHDACARYQTAIRRRNERIAELETECGQTNGPSGPFICNLPAGHDGDHCKRITYASWAAEGTP